MQGEARSSRSSNAVAGAPVRPTGAHPRLAVDAPEVADECGGDGESSVVLHPPAARDEVREPRFEKGSLSDHPLAEGEESGDDVDAFPRSGDDVDTVPRGGGESGLSQQAAGDEFREPGDEQGRRPQVLRGPPRVSRQEREEHELTHVPYRSWCPYCVKGRARNTPHRRAVGQGRSEATPKVSMDYFYMSTADQLANENPILVMLDEATGERYARAVGKKGLGSEGERDWLIKDLSEELRTWGHAGGTAGHIILKTDGERSITAVRDALARYHGGKVVPETPPRGESQSNGAVEEAGKIVREYARVLKEQIEDKANVKLAESDILVLWMIRWSAMLYSRFAVGQDGRAPYERRRGRRCNTPLVAFGEKVWYKELRTHKERQNKFDTEWFEGIWLGHARHSNEHVIGTRLGAVRAYAIKRKPDDQRWDAELLKDLKGTPQQPDPERAGITVPISVRIEPLPVEQRGPQDTAREEPRQIRRMRITEALLQQHGYTAGCEGCRFRRAGLGETRPHTEVCRSRLEAAMARDEAGRRALEEQRQRLERRRAERAEEARGQPQAEPPGQEPQGESERAQNTGAGCSNPGARLDEPLIAPEAQDSEMAESQQTTGQEGESHLVGPPSDPVGGRRDLGDEGPRRGDSLECCPSGGRARSRSPKRGIDRTLGTPQAGEILAGPVSAAVKRPAPEEEPEPKRVRPDIEESDMDLGALMKLVTVGPGTKISTEIPLQEEPSPAWSFAWDDTSGEQLDPDEVRRARATEMDYINGRGVWRKVPRSLASRNGWKVIDTRWIDVNKGDHQTPNYRSRLVAKEFNDGAQDGLFAATPPLEALRLLISDAATEGEHKMERVLMLNDVARAFFEAPMTRTVCVELPSEARVEGEEEDMVGLLQLSLYGTRDAAANFQAEVRKFLLSEGFSQSAYSPQVYWHRARDLKTFVHGDDFVTSGARTEAVWLRDRLMQRFEIKTHIIGAGAEDVSEHRVLGRIIRVTPSGWEYEADPRHAELLIKGMRLEAANGVKCPGEDPRAWEIEENGEPLSVAEGREYRAMAARANYLAQDRFDIAFAAKECCRGMANPTKGDIKALRRLVRYLCATPRVVWRYDFQPLQSQINVFSDSDWAGCRRTARSTSGGVAMLGTHCLRGYSVTQKFVTLSSGEAELMAMVKATAEAIGLTQLAESWGIRLEAAIFADSSAALAVTNRRGCGKLRHVRIGHLWIQELAADDTVRFAKVAGEVNPADLATKHLSPSKREQLLPLVRQFACVGDAASRLRLGIFHRSSGCTVTDGHDRTIGGSTKVLRALPCILQQGLEFSSGTLPAVRQCDRHGLQLRGSDCRGSSHSHLL